MTSTSQPIPIAPTALPFDEDALGDAYARGLDAEKRGATADAVAAYRACLAIDPADHCGVRIRLAALGAGETPDSAGDAYVATLFDQHAESFEDILVRQLRYSVPERLAERLVGIGPDVFDRLLDLGCGTGLAVEALGDRVGEATGVDLSEAMIEICDDKGLYDRLFVAEAVTFLAAEPEPRPYDLIVATDVLPYLGPLEPLAAHVAARLSPGGLFAASTETLDATAFAGAPFKVGTGQRFHHDEAYLRKVLAAEGFEVVAFDPITVRLQEGEPAPGHLVVARASR